MAEVLIKTVDAVHDDPAKDAAGCYKIEDVVVIAQDGNQWGRDEVPPKFFVVKLPNVSFATLAPLLESQVDMVLSPLDDKTHPKIMRRRAYSIDLNALKLLGGQTSPITVNVGDTQAAKFIKKKAPV